MIRLAVIFPSIVMELKDILLVLYERIGAFQATCSLYITVALGVVGFVSTVKSAFKPRYVRLVLILLFIVFAAINFTNLEKIWHQRTLLIDLGLELTSSQSILVSRLLEESRVVLPLSILGSFHLILDLVVVFFVWFIPEFIDESEPNN